MAARAATSTSAVLCTTMSTPLLVLGLLNLLLVASTACNVAGAPVGARGHDEEVYREKARLAKEHMEKEQCARVCAEENCDNVGIRYGKYCGVGWGGCAGEEPCDALDACCQAHDTCAMKFGPQAVECHKVFKRCMQKVWRTGKPGFSTKCPYDVAIPTMTEGMDIAIMLSEFATGGGGASAFG